MKFMYQGRLYENVEPTKSVTAYHVTFAKNIESILHNGLQLGNGSGIGTGAYQQWSAGKLFFSTCADDVSFWLSKYEDHAVDRSDDFLLDGMIPIVLRFEVDQFEPDEVGAKEGRHCSFYTKTPIPAEDIEVYLGDWGWLDEKIIDLQRAVDDDGFLKSEAFTPRDIPNG